MHIVILLIVFGLIAYYVKDTFIDPWQREKRIKNNTPLNREEEEAVWANKCWDRVQRERKAKERREARKRYYDGYDD